MLSRTICKRFTVLLSVLKLDAVREEIATNYKSLKKFKVAILREQGVNGHREMAAAFHQVEFNCVDVHMQDLISKTFDLSRFDGLAIVGVFCRCTGQDEDGVQVVLANNFLRGIFSFF